MQMLLMVLYLNITIIIIIIISLLYSYYSHNFNIILIIHYYYIIKGAPDICGGEHNMEYYALFQKYLKVYEDSLTEYVQSLNCTIEEFYKEVREYQADTADPYIVLFIDCLLASADYESFYKVMVKESRKKLKITASSSLKVSDIDINADEKKGSKEDEPDVKEGSYTDYKAEGKESK